MNNRLSLLLALLVISVMGFTTVLVVSQERQNLSTEAAGISHVQTAAITDDGGGSDISQAFLNSNSAGNLIVAAVSWSGGGALTCSDTQGNTYITVTSDYDSQNDQGLGICYAANIQSGANTVTANMTPGGAFRRFIIHEYSGVATVNPVDVTAKNIADGSTAANAITSTQATTTANGDLIFGAVMDDSGVTSITAGTGFTQRNSVNNKDLVTQDRVQSTAGAVASTQTFGDAHRYLAQMVAFKAGSPSTITTTPSATPVPGSTMFSLNLLLHGLGKGGDSANPTSVGNNNPAHPQRTVSIEVFNSQNQLVLTKQGTVNFNSTNGNFTGTVNMGNTLATGVYSVKIKENQYLRALVPGIQTVTAGQTFTVPQTTLIAGDINNDNILNVADYNILIGCYSDLAPAVNCTATNKVLADITDDGNVNAFDYNLLLRELTNVQGTPGGGTLPTATPTTAAPTPTRTPTPAAPTPTGTAGVWPPTPQSVGIPDGLPSPLPNYTGSCTITTDGLTIDAKTINCSTLYINATGVKITRSLVKGAVRVGAQDDSDPSGTGAFRVTIEDSEINVAAGGGGDFRPISASHYIVRRSYLHGTYSGGECHNRCIVEGNYIEGFGEHASGMRILKNGTLKDNTIWCKPNPNSDEDRDGQPDSDGGCSGDLTVYQEFGTPENIVVEHNYFPAGLFWYTLKFNGSDNGGLRFVNNRIGLPKSGGHVADGWDPKGNISCTSLPSNWRTIPDSNIWCGNVYTDGRTANPGD